ncbi:pro-epidermal growth factor isoform X2 [Electrophorus electricus]|uniref:pro-epidermal growth factor isoform X2 n=1 Tax=Electrophorus electricus TaxID=8005 RepID=UPI0015D01204|nr:pro-epidermal growth factor isoform X2 [Electrophorus electricus]
MVTVALCPRERLIVTALSHCSGIMFLGRLAAVLHLCFWVGNGGPAQDSSPASAGACWGSHSMAGGNWSCVDFQPYLLVGMGNAILRMSLGGGEQERILSGVGSSVLLDFHSREGCLYWVNTHTGVLSRAHLGGTHRQTLLSLGKGISGLAVDWIENSVFWSIRKRGRIQRAQTDGKNEKTVLRDLSQPSSLVIDPNERYLFWLSKGVTFSIQRSDVVGGERITVLKVADRLLALAIDPVDRRLFWVQQGLRKRIAMGSCDYNGNLVNVVRQHLRSKSLKMSVFLNYVYITDSLSKSIMRVNKYTGGSPEKVGSRKMLHVPADIRVIHSTIQPVVETGTPSTPVCDPQTEECVSVCSSPRGSGRCDCKAGFSLSKQGGYCEDVNECARWNHGCSLGCQNVPGSYFCTCPKGYTLLPDTKTCREIEPCVENGTLCDHACTHTPEGDVCVCPVGSTLQPDGHSCTGCLSMDGGGCSQVCVTLSPGRWVCECQPGYQLQPDGKQCKATGPPAYLLYANTVDIRRVNTDGTGDRRVLQNSGESILALDYDPMQDKVYFASISRHQIERVSMEGGSREVLLFGELDMPEGLAVDWINRKLYWTDTGLSSISRSGLDGVDREVLVHEKILKPRGIAVHPQAQMVFWTDMGSRPAVERSGLDGTGREVLVRSGLVSPSGLSLDYTSQRLYWCDISTGIIESANMDGSDRHTLSQYEVARPFSVSVFEDSLWVSSWDDNQIHQLTKRTGHDSECFRGDPVQPAALVIVHPLARPGTDACLYGNGGCSQLCESTFGLARCSCHSQHILSADGRTCLPTDTSSSETGGEAQRLRNETLSDEGVPLALSTTASLAGEPAPFTETMVSDQDECSALSCGVNAQCLLVEGTASCHCLRGFTHDGQLCVDTDECTAGLAECNSLRSECVNTAGGYFCQCRTGFSGDEHHCIDIDECHLEIHRCDVNAICLNTLGEYECRCRHGYTVSGSRCHEDPKGAPSKPSTSSPLDVTFPWRHDDSVQSCPSTHDSYCMYDGVCFYLPELESYICNCVAGYMGERCQFSDMEWWDLQQAEQETRRNVAIVVCLVLLLLLISVTASLTYCYSRCRKCLRERPPVDSISERRMSITEQFSSSPQFYVVLDHGACSSGNMLHIVDCQRRGVFPSSTSETGPQYRCLTTCRPREEVHHYRDLVNPTRLFSGSACSRPVADGD